VGGGAVVAAAAFRWLGDDSEGQRLREEQPQVALAVVIVGLIGVALAFLRRGTAKLLQ
jgi:hypothetical protein